MIDIHCRFMGVITTRYVEYGKRMHCLYAGFGNTLTCCICVQFYCSWEPSNILSKAIGATVASMVVTGDCSGFVSCYVLCCCSLIARKTQSKCKHLETCSLSIEWLPLAGVFPKKTFLSQVSCHVFVREATRSRRGSLCSVSGRACPQTL